LIVLANCTSSFVGLEYVHCNLCYVFRLIDADLIKRTSRFAMSLAIEIALCCLSSLT
jgi:hypothetical protein